jgi:hypothetical protein
MIYSEIVFEEKTENCSLVLFPILNNTFFEQVSIPRYKTGEKDVTLLP